VSHLHAQPHALSLPEHGHVHLLVDRSEPDDGNQMFVVIDQVADEFQYDVIRAEPAKCRWALRCDALDQRPARTRHSQPQGEFRREVVFQMTSEIRADEPPMFDELRGDGPDHVDGDGEANTFTPTRAAGDCRIDPDYLAAQVKQRPAAV